MLEKQYSGVCETTTTWEAAGVVLYHVAKEAFFYQKADVAVMDIYSSIVLADIEGAMSLRGYFIQGLVRVGEIRISM